MLFQDMIQAYDINLSLIVRGMIVPAYQQVILEHRITKNHLWDICLSSTIIPKNRIDLWVEGLYYGFENNFVVSSHLLVPQIENMIRFFMKEKDIKTTTLGNDGIETENGLTTLLNNENITDVIDESLVFELKALLTEQIGSNLRNNIAHGLVTSHILASKYSVYFWWLCLKLVINSSNLNYKNKES